MVQDSSLKMDRDTVRWYILRLPECHRGHAVALERAKAVCMGQGETGFDYLAPTFKEKRMRAGREVLVDVSTLFNYVFVRSSVATILQLKKTVLMPYNFLKRYTFGGQLYYPYVNDDTMETLRWVASSYKNVIPCYIPSSVQLARGDVIRFTAGSFAGMAAEIVTIPGTRHKEFVIRVRIEDGCTADGGGNELFSVPIHADIAESTFVVEKLNVDDKQLYARLDNTRLLDDLFSSLILQRHTLLTTDDSRFKASDIIRQYGSVFNARTNILRSKLFSYLLPSYRLLGLKKEYDENLRMAASLVDAVSACQAKVLLCLTLFACTGEYFWQDKAARLLDGGKAVKRQELFAQWLQMLVQGLEPVSLRQFQRKNVLATFPAMLRDILDKLSFDAGSIEDLDRKAISQVHAALLQLQPSCRDLLSQAGIDDIYCERFSITRAGDEEDSCPGNVDELLNQALDEKDTGALLSLRPQLQGGTYTIAVNNDARTQAHLLAWVVLPMTEGSIAALCLKALVCIDVMRTI